jgi:hypothetical protein
LPITAHAPAAPSSAPTSDVPLQTVEPITPSQPAAIAASEVIPTEATPLSPTPANPITSFDAPIERKRRLPAVGNLAHQTEDTLSELVHVVTEHLPERLRRATKDTDPTPSSPAVMVETKPVLPPSAVSEPEPILPVAVTAQSAENEKKSADNPITPF